MRLELRKGYPIFAHSDIDVGHQVVHQGPLGYIHTAGLNPQFPFFCLAVQIPI